MIAPPRVGHILTVCQRMATDLQTQARVIYAGGEQ